MELFGGKNFQVCARYGVRAVINVSDASGLPWWAAVAASTVAFRFLLFPFAVQQQKAVVAMAKIQPQMQDLRDKMQRHKAGCATLGRRCLSLIVVQRSPEHQIYVQKISKIMKGSGTSIFKMMGAMFFQVRILRLAIGSLKNIDVVGTYLFCNVCRPAEDWREFRFCMSCGYVSQSG